MAWDFETAFTRNLGLVSSEELETLRTTRVAIIGAGGGGGIHAITLARQGFGCYRIADPDTFSVVNFNRQAGAFVSTVGKNKAETMAAMVHDINPEAEIDVWPCAVTNDNVDAFVGDAQVVIDALDVFAPDARRMLYSAARRHRKWVLTAGPMGYSGVFLAFSPDGMSFDEYFGIDDQTSYIDKVIAFVVGIAPAGLHRDYTDMSVVNVEEQSGPSAALACNLAASMIAVETMALVLGRRPPRAAPAYLQIDLFKHRVARGRLWFGGRGPGQRLRRWLATRYFRRMGLFETVPKELRS